MKEMKLQVEYRWLDGTGLGAPIFFFVCGAVGLYLGNGSYLGNEPLLFVLSIVCFVLVTYAALAHVLNKTEFSVSQREITIRHGPLPWFGNRVIPVSELQSFERSDRNNEGNLYYNFHCTFTNGKRANLFFAVNIVNPGTAENVLRKVAAYHKVELRNINHEGHQDETPGIFRSISRRDSGSLSCDFVSLVNFVVGG